MVETSVKLRPIVFTALCVSFSGPVGAQQVIRVLDISDVPLAAARVELWSTSNLIAARLTDIDGAARFSAPDVARARYILTRRVGYLPSRDPVDGSRDSLVVHLAPLPGALPTVTVSAAQDACPQTDEPAARRLWEAAVARYRTPSLEGRRADTRSGQNQVRERDVGIVDDVQPNGGWRFYSHAGMIGARERILRRGYATPLVGTHHYDDFGIWRYPPLHAELAGQFADSLFGARHSLSLSTTSRRYTELRFCARDRDRTGLDGTLRLAADGSFMDARWRFWNPSRDAELAGGEVSFAPPADTGRAPLYSTGGLFWRRLPSGRYWQSWQHYSSWELLPDSVGAARESSR